MQERVEGARNLAHHPLVEPRFRMGEPRAAERRRVRWGVMKTVERRIGRKGPAAIIAENQTGHKAGNTAVRKAALFARSIGGLTGLPESIVRSHAPLDPRPPPDALRPPTRRLF